MNKHVESNFLFLGGGGGGWNLHVENRQSSGPHLEYEAEVVEPLGVL